LRKIDPRLTILLFLSVSFCFTLRFKNTDAKTKRRPTPTVVVVTRNEAIADPSIETSFEGENNNNNNLSSSTVVPGVLQMRGSSSKRRTKKGHKTKNETLNFVESMVESTGKEKRGGLQSKEFATVQMIMKMEGQCRVTFQFPSDFDREVGQTFKVFGRFKVILSEKFVEEAVSEGGEGAVTGNVIVHDKSPAMEQFRKLEPGDEVKISCYRTSDMMDGRECDDIYNHVLEEEEEEDESNDDINVAQSMYHDEDGDDFIQISLGSEGKANHDEILEAHRRNLEHAALESPSAATNGEQQQQRSSASSEQGYVSEQSFFGDSTIPDATPQCFVEHPGVISCSKRLIKENDDGSFELWIKTKAFQAVDSDPSIYESVSKRGLIAIGAKALEEEAKQFSDKCRNEAVDETTREASEFARERESIHAGITNILQHGDIVNCVSLAKLNSFGHPTYKLRLRCRDTGREIDCMFKPKIAGDGDGWHQVLMELVAYKLNRVLGMDYVPPTAYRMNRKGPACSKKDTQMGNNPIQCDYKEFDEGAFIYWAQESQTLKEVHPEHWKTSQKQVLSDTRVMDVLLGNSDRHHGHFLFAEHWVNAKPIPEVFRNEISDDNGDRQHNNNHNNVEDMQSNHYPILIDHAAAFRDGAWVDMTHENAFQTGPTLCVSAKTYFRLRLLDARAIAKEFDGILTTSECRRLLSRRNDLLRYLDNLVAEKGYENVIL
jgi:hypothetical protein